MFIDGRCRNFIFRPLIIAERCCNSTNQIATPRSQKTRSQNRISTPPYYKHRLLYEISTPPTYNHMYLHGISTPLSYTHRYVFVYYMKSQPLSTIITCLYSRVDFAKYRDKPPRLHRSESLDNRICNDNLQSATTLCTSSL